MKLLRLFQGLRFNSAECNYPVHEKELLAVVRGIDANKLFLGKPFLIRSDSTYVKNFMGIRLRKFGQARLVRWRNELEYYRFRVEYLKSEKKNLADALTRELVNYRILQKVEWLQKEEDLWQKAEDQRAQPADTI